MLLERERRLARSLIDTKERLKADTVRVENADALAWMARCAAASFELVFIDPPFESETIVPALDAALRVVVEGGYIYLEAAHALPPHAAEERGLRMHRQSRAGAVHFHLLQRVAATGAAADAAPA